jgi:hypothetical protein
MGRMPGNLSQNYSAITLHPEQTISFSSSSSFFNKNSHFDTSFMNPLLIKLKTTKKLKDIALLRIFHSVQYKTF